MGWDSDNFAIEPLLSLPKPKKLDIRLQELLRREKQSLADKASRASETKAAEVERIKREQNSLLQLAELDAVKAELEKYKKINEALVYSPHLAKATAKGAVERLGEVEAELAEYKEAFKRKGSF
jgi:hypothetical protein